MRKSPKKSATFFVACSLAALSLLSPGPGRARTIDRDPVPGTPVRRFSLPVIDFVLGPDGGRSYARASDRIADGATMPRSFWWTRAAVERRWTFMNGPIDPFYPKLLAVDPAQPDTVYSTGVGGTVFRSLDAGATWERRGAVPGGDVYQILVLGPDVLLQGNTSVCAPCRSHDGGMTWETSAGYYGVLVPAPSDPDVVYQITGVSIRRSQDGARMFVDLPAGPPGGSDLVVAPSDPQVVYAVALQPALDFLSRTIDGGATWQKLTAPEAGLTWSSPAVDPASPSHLVILGGPEDASLPRRLFESFDGGLTWTPRAGTVDATRLRLTGGTIEAFGRRGLFASAGPGDPWRLRDQGINTDSQLLLAGSGRDLYVVNPEIGDFWHSSDAGGNWEPRGTRPDLQALVADPFDSTRLVGIDQQLLSLSWSDDGGRTWTSRPGPRSRQVSAFILSLTFDPHRRNTVYASTLEDAWRSTDRGATWSRFTGSLRAGTDCTTFHCFKIRDVEQLVPDPFMASRFYAVAHSYETVRTENGGATWKPVKSPLLAATDQPRVIPDPRVRDHLYWGIRVETTVLESLSAGDPPWRTLLRDAGFAPAGTGAWLTFDPEGRLVVAPQWNTATFLRRLADTAGSDWERFRVTLPYEQEVQILNPLVPAPGGGTRLFLLVPGLGLFRADLPEP